MKGSTPNEKQLERAANLLKVIANPTRMKIIELLLGHGSLSVTDICIELSMEQALISHNLIKMQNKGLLESQRNGHRIFYNLVDESMGKLMDCIYKLAK